MTIKNARTVIMHDDEISRYMSYARRQPVLTFDEEQAYARAAAKGDVHAVEMLTRSHLRLVARLATKTRYGVSHMDLISEGTIGLLQGISKFDPDKGFRLSTYAQWWIKAAMQEYVLRNWGMMKITGSATQKRLFFNLGHTKRRLNIYDDDNLTTAQIQEIAKTLHVGHREVVEMEMRFAAGSMLSLNEPVGGASSAEGSRDDLQSTIVDASPGPEDQMLDRNEMQRRRTMLHAAMTLLKPREREILERRKLNDEPATFAQLAKEYGLTGERIRQIETIALRKISRTVLAYSNDDAELPHAA